ncbi:hypothetical protein HAX54_030189 [Datura stramonium]|uniref:Uncharacterized protein n=1 Tax=Datura stramonium TaxID=4076 RepID=A0ABS8V8L3_DATST|nr:hypothetical protein [Datura stramonium]
MTYPIVVLLIVQVVVAHAEKVHFQKWSNRWSQRTVLLKNGPLYRSSYALPADLKNHGSNLLTHSMGLCVNKQPLYARRFHRGRRRADSDSEDPPANDAEEQNNDSKESEDDNNQAEESNEKGNSRKESGDKESAAEESDEQEDSDPPTTPDARTRYIILIKEDLNPIVQVRGPIVEPRLIEGALDKASESALAIAGATAMEAAVDFETSTTKDFALRLHDARDTMMRRYNDEMTHNVMMQVWYCMMQSWYWIVLCGIVEVQVVAGLKFHDWRGSTQHSSAFSQRRSSVILFVSVLFRALVPV